MTHRLAHPFHPGPRQIALLRSGLVGYVTALGSADRRAMLRLHDRGLMDRHPTDSDRFSTNARGEALLEHMAGDDDGVDVSHMGRA